MSQGRNLSGPVARFLEASVGPYEVTRRFHTDTDTIVAALAGPGDEHWIVKSFRHRWPWSRELRAYRQWTPTLGGQAACLRHADEATRTLVLDQLPGHRTDAPGLITHRRAGRLLAALHGCRPARAGWSRRLGRLGRELARMTEGGVPTNSVETAYVRSQFDRLSLLPPLPLVVCHGDYGPHNWLVDDKGTVRVVDFVDARWHTRAFDLARLQYRYWWDEPELREAFSEGYGRPLTPPEVEAAHALLAIAALGSAVRSSRLGIPERVARARTRIAALAAGHGPA